MFKCIEFSVESAHFNRLLWQNKKKVLAKLRAKADNFLVKSTQDEDF